jgi:hypothetical protein
VTSYVIPEACANIVYSIVPGERDAFRDASSTWKTRVTSVTVMGIPYLRDVEFQTSTVLSSVRTCSATLNLALMYPSSAYATTRVSWNLANTRPQMVYTTVRLNTKFCEDDIFTQLSLKLFLFFFHLAFFSSAVNKP